VSAGQAVVAVRQLSKWYGQVCALNDLTVAIPAGVTGLLGPNGAGKSTLMKLITGQLRPSQGEVRVLGQAVWGNPDLFLRVGYCPEQDAFYEEMTGLAWVRMLAELSGLPAGEAETAARRALALLDLGDAAGRPIGSYSKGMRQRVKLAQAIAHEPDLLVLDEPLLGLDPLGRRAVMTLIRAWGRDGRSIIVSSHVLHEVEALTSTIVLIDRGRVLAEGDVHQIRALIDRRPHTVRIRAGNVRELASWLAADEGVRSVRFEQGAITVETAAPDALYARVTALAAEGRVADVTEVTSPDDNLQAVFRYLVEP